MNNNFDVLIIGGGMVGASLACALGDSRLKIGVIDNRAPTPPLPTDPDPRVSAITLASRHLFQNLGVWDRLLERGTVPIEGMHVWEAQGEIHFDAAEIGEACLAYIVENTAIQHVLVQRLQSFTNVHALWPVQIEAIDVTDAQAIVKLSDGRQLATRLLVGADGADSAVRRAVGIGSRHIDMNQKAIVATVHTQKPHRHIARQRFLPTGPLALLPLADSAACSIVWSVDTARAESIMALTDAAFLSELQTAFGDALGQFVSIGRRQAFALALAQAERYTDPRVALIGDAAHTVHPLAGQGVNLGLLDAAVLADTVLAAASRGRDVGAHMLLRRYERARKGDNLGMIAVTGSFKYLFGNDLALIRTLRNLGLRLTNALAPAKRMIMRRAAGVSGDLPALARAPRSVK